MSSTQQPAGGDAEHTGQEDRAEQAPEAPEFVDLDRPSAARIYDWYLGGAQNFALDREFGKRMIEQFPLIQPAVVSNRRWLGRVVRAALDAGITQFLDLGAGIPSVGPPHQFVRDAVGDQGRVVYVDYEPVAYAHATLLVEREGAQQWCGVLDADYRTPEAVLGHEVTRSLLDFTRPVCVLLASVLQFVGDQDDIPGTLASYRDRLSPGSWMAISHPAVDDADPDEVAKAMPVARSYQDTQNPLWVRDRDEIAGWFAGLDMVEPGLTHAVDWRPDEADADEQEARVRPFYWAGAGAVPV